MILGVTGGTGCGKTTLLEVAAQCGGTVIDCDRVYHGLLESDEAMLREIAAAFPDAIENGTINRKKLGKLVFADADALQRLNAVTHRAVFREVEKMLPADGRLTVIDAIGLFESGLSALCDVTVNVTAPMESRIARLIARDGIDEAYAHLRIQAQPTPEAFSARCDYTLINDGTEAQFRAKCLAFLHEQGIITEKGKGV